MLWVLKRTVSISGSYNGLENIYNFKLKKCLCKCVRNAHKAETLYRIKKSWIRPIPILARPDDISSRTVAFCALNYG